MKTTSRVIGSFAIASLLSLTLVPSVSAGTVVPASARKFSTCSNLLKVYKNGLASSTKAKGKTKAAVNAAVYRSNKKLDVNGNGIACDQADLPSKSGSSGAAARRFVPKTYEGSGDRTIALSIPAGFVAAAIVEFDGEEGVMMTTLDADDNAIDFPVMSTGPYSGTVLLSRGADPDEPMNVAAIEIAGQGNWKLKVVSAASLPLFGRQATGTSDSVYRYMGNDVDIDVTHDGDESFTMAVYDKAGVLIEITADEYGEFADIYAMSAGAFIAIRAAAPWSITKL